jgi:hypothetical protein
MRPHADSLSSIAWVDLSKGPLVLGVPPIDRFYLLPVYNAWYDLEFVVSSRTAEGGARNFGLVGPHWQGRLPESVERVSLTTDTAWINGRFQADTADIDSVHRVQDQVRLTPLSEWGRPAVSHSNPFLPNVDSRTSPQEQVFSLDTATFYTRLAKLLRRITPQAYDTPMFERLAQIGILAGTDFAFEMLDAATVRAMHAALPAAQAKITSAEQSVDERVADNWSLHVHPGRFETRYMDRALGVRQALASSLADDVVCFHTNVDQAGQLLKGSHHYVIHFDQGHSPPVNAFWSITLYNARYLPAANPINRYHIGSLDRLRIHNDNSVSIYIQHQWPGIDTDSNWLPAPGDAFELVLQLYWPKPEVLQGRWRPPAVVRVI